MNVIILHIMSERAPKARSYKLLHQSSVAVGEYILLPPIPRATTGNQDLEKDTF
jgi:hypothetical protein